jgi:glycine betaine/proline transport system permease protein
MFLNLSIQDPINGYVNWLVSNYGGFFHGITLFLLHYFLIPLEIALRWIPPWAVLIALGLLGFHATKKIVPTVLFVACAYLIGCFGLWDKLMLTLALMLVSTILCVLIGIPLGILTSRSNRLQSAVLPVLDVMQTMPGFVYLIPVLMLFNLGKVPAIFATIIYALPPLIRLTNLGIRQVDGEIKEAAAAFGLTPWQMLLGVEIPLARPSIMAGVNQTIMMALAMVVVASMIGARGLGEDVLEGINTLNVGKGSQAGIAVVILAIIIDRISQAYGMDSRTRQKLGKSA